jgi:hypothetical protein
LLDEINPIARAVMDSEFRDAIANGRSVMFKIEGKGNQSDSSNLSNAVWADPSKAAGCS